MCALSKLNQLLGHLKYSTSGPVKRFQGVNLTDLQSDAQALINFQVPYLHAVSELNQIKSFLIHVLFSRQQCIVSIPATPDLDDRHN